MSRILVAWTPNEYGAAAVDRGVIEARLRGLPMLVVNATKGDAYVDDRYAGASALEALRGELAGLDVEADVRQVMGADVADELLAASEEVDAEMIVIGVRHRTAVGKLLMGSVAQRVVLDATCPVLCVKPPRDQGSIWGSK
jgi:nucleotide-binding universal stress UspA family protein